MDASKTPELSLCSVEKAAQLICPHALRTPVLHSDYLDELAGVELFFKCENLQRTGSFKFRGACHALLQLSEEQRAQGVYTVSSGNHGAALACAGQRLGIHVTVAVPTNGLAVKKQNIARYGATMIDIEPGMAAREAFVEQQQGSGQHFIPPYNHPDIIAGQGTAALELWHDYPQLTCMLTPVGGGGLLSGTALVARAEGIGKVFAAEPELADDAHQSLQLNAIQPAREPVSICDGLLTSLGDHTFPVIREHVTEILIVGDDETRDAQKLLWQELKVLVEPSSAITLAAVLKYPEQFAGERVGIILSGGNVALASEQFA